MSPEAVRLRSTLLTNESTGKSEQVDSGDKVRGLAWIVRLKAAAVQGRPRRWWWNNSDTTRRFFFSNLVLFSGKNAADACAVVKAMRSRVFPRCSEAIADTHLPHGRLALLPRLRCHGNQSTVYVVPVCKDTSFRDVYRLLISVSLTETAKHVEGSFAAGTADKSEYSRVNRTMAGGG